MITISKINFEELIEEEFLELPIKWNGIDYSIELLFDDYKNLLAKYINKRD